MEGNVYLLARAKLNFIVSTDTEQVVEEFTRPIIKLLLALIGLFVLRFIVTSLPGLGTPIPGTPVTFSILAGAIITLVMIAILVNFGREIEPRISRVLTGPDHLANNLANATKLLIFLIAILIAYDGLEGVIIPFIVPDPGRWTYDILFLLIALVPTGIIAQRIFNNLDDMTEMLTQQVKSATVSDIECSECGEQVRKSLDFCPNCGNELTTGETVPASKATSDSSKCPECGTKVDESMAFCGRCGKSIDD